MPLPKLTAKIIASSKEIEIGWSLLELKDTRSQAAKSGNGTNYFFDFEAVSGPNSSEENAGRSVTFMVSGGGLEAGISDVCATYFGLLYGLTGLPQEDLKDMQVDENALKGKRCWAMIDSRVVEGKKYFDLKACVPPTEIPY